MVLYDDKKWLCRLIRTAFTIEDDTGVCEKVLKSKAALPIAVNQHQEGDSSSLSSNDSYDIREGADLGHRRRSNTAIRLEKLEKQKKAQNLTQVVRVNNAVEAPKTLINFVKDTNYTTKPNHRTAIPVDKLLQSVPNPEKIPYANYAKFDALGHPGTMYKRMAIFLPFLPPEHRHYPLRVAVIGTAKIHELIGLILWMASQTYPATVTNDLLPVTYYCLKIADEDGDYDTDFPSLDFSEPISKFSFGHLALLKCENSHEMHSLEPLKVNLSFLLPNGNIFKLSVDTKDITLSDTLVLLLQKSGWGKITVPPVQAYHFEKMGDPSTQFLDLSLSVGDTKCKEFCLVRNGAKSVQSATVRTETASGFGASPSEIPGTRSSLYPVIVSTGRFNRVKNAFCVIWSGDRMDLEFQHKTKSYSLATFSGVKYDPMKNRVVISISQYSQSAPMGAHYLTGTSHLTLTTSDRQIATELYHHLISVIGNK